MSNKLKSVTAYLVIYLIAIFCFSPLALAQTKDNPNSNPNTKEGLKGVNTINLGIELKGSNLGILPAQTTGGQGIVGTILRNVITLLFVVGGIGTIIYFIWGAVDWIMSGGDKEKVSSARKKMTHALIGLVLLSAAFVIIRVVGQIVGFNPLDKIELRRLEDQ